MNMPRFTADAALYQTSGHYRTGRNRGAIHLAARMISPIYPAEINVGHEIIPIGPCAPGWEEIGGTCFPNPLTEPPLGSSGVPGTGGLPSPGGGGTPEPMDNKPEVDKPPPKLRKSPVTGAPFKPKHDKPCHAIEYTWGGGVLVEDPSIVSTGTYGALSGGVFVCHQPPGDPRNDVRCGKTEDLGNGDTRRVDCYNGHSPN